MPRFSIDLQYQMAAATATFERLLFLDEVWTRAVAGKASVRA
jgi:hypothetical protein